MASLEVYSSIKELKQDRKQRKLTADEMLRQKRAAQSLTKIQKKPQTITPKL